MALSQQHDSPLIPPLSKTTEPVPTNHSHSNSIPISCENNAAHQYWLPALTMELLILFLWAAFVKTVFPYPTDASSDTLMKRDNPTIGVEFSAIEKAQIEQGFRDACSLAHIGFGASSNYNGIYTKYFPDAAHDPQEGIINNVHSVFGAVVGGKAPPQPCSEVLSAFTVRKDFINPATGELSCTRPGDMASTRDGESENPIMVLCPSAMAHGNIGPVTITGTPAPVTCNKVKEDGNRVTWRMNTLASTIFHEYTHFADLVGAALPQGSKDSLDEAEDPTGHIDEQTFFYGPLAVQAGWFVQAGLGEIIADSYTWLANEALWSQKCNVNFARAVLHDDEDPLFGGGPGQDPDSEP